MMASIGVSKLVKHRSISSLLRTHFLTSRTNSFKFQTIHRSFASVVPNLVSAHGLDAVVGSTIPEFFWSRLQNWENATAFECGVTGRKYTHLEVYKQSRSFATALKQHGLKKDDIVAVLLPNIPEFAAVLLGALDAGCVASPFNPTYTAYEIATQIKKCEASTIVTIPESLPQVKEAQKECPSLKSIIVVGEPQEGCHTYFEMVKVNPQGVEFLKGSDIDSLDQLAILPWSSGTTGPPKGVMLTHSNIMTNLLQSTRPGFLLTKPFMKGNEQDRLMGMLPFFHIYGFLLVMAKTIYHGSHTLTLKRFDPATFIACMRKHKPNYLHLVPPLIGFLGECPDVTTKDLETVTGVMNGAAPCSPLQIEQLLEKAGGKMLFQEGYGMTEMSPVSHLTPRAAKNNHLGKCGVPVPGTVCKLVDPLTGKTVGPHTPGELFVKGPQVMKGYYKNEKATKDTIDAEGWLCTGDVMMYDDNNYFWIVDRAKELIKVKGFQVAPTELEDLLKLHPEVEDVAVIGVPNKATGELPRAYVVPKNWDATPSMEDLHKCIDVKLSPYKKLKGGIEFVKSIPKGASGKILRKDLRKDYMEKYGDAAPK